MSEPRRTSAGELRFPDAIPALVTARLSLRALEPADEHAVFQMHASPEAMRYWSSPPWTDPARASEYVARAGDGFAGRRSVRWAIARRDDATVVGTAVLFSIDEQCRRAELGYLLSHAHWGQGYMREALTAVLDWGFGPFGLHRVEADVDPRNEASLRLLEHLGFTREGLLRDRWIVEGEISDTAFCGLLHDEWAARRASNQAPDVRPRPRV